jgi:RNA polymerase sigma factor (sigma-70 family)
VSHDDGEIVAALGRLSYEQRAVLVLRYWADWDEEAIAEALGCRPSTVRSHARRALVLLRQEVQR